MKRKLPKFQVKHLERLYFCSWNQRCETSTIIYKKL